MEASHVKEAEIVFTVVYLAEGKECSHTSRNCPVSAFMLEAWRKLTGCYGACHLEVPAGNLGDTYPAGEIERSASRTPTGEEGALLMSISAVLAE